MIEHHDEAVAFARRGLLAVWAALPSWGLQNGDYDVLPVIIEERQFCLAIGPWLYKRGGRAFHIWPANSSPAGSPTVKGFVEITESGLNIQPSQFKRPRNKRQSMVDVNRQFTQGAECP